MQKIHNYLLKILKIILLISFFSNIVFTNNYLFSETKEETKIIDLEKNTENSFSNYFLLKENQNNNESEENIQKENIDLKENKDSFNDFITDEKEKIEDSSENSVKDELHIKETTKETKLEIQNTDIKDINEDQKEISNIDRKDNENIQNNSININQKQNDLLKNEEKDQKSPLFKLEKKENDFSISNNLDNENLKNTEQKTENNLKNNLKNAGLDSEKPKKDEFLKTNIVIDNKNPKTKVVNKLQEDSKNSLKISNIQNFEDTIAWNKDVYRNIRYDREKGLYKKQESFLSPDIDLSYIEEYRSKNIDKIKNDIDESLIQMNLPYQSKLSISGRKMVAFDYGIINYKSDNKTDQTESPTDIKSGVDMRQEMQLRVKGKIGNKITVNVNYDDSEEVDKQDISIVYKGYKKGDLIKESDDGTEQVFANEDEVIEEVAFGDILFEIPQTEFIGYKRTLFGLRMKAKYNRFNLLAVGSQTEGIVEKKEFKGNTSEEHKLIDDRSYIKRTYYKLYFDDAQFSQDFPMQKGTEEIYLFDQTSTTSGYTLYEKDIEKYGGGLDKTYKMKKLQSGTDYEIDTVDGILKLKRYISSNYVIAVDYVNKNGQKLSASNNKIKYLKDEYNNSSITNEIKWYYDLGNTNIKRGDLGTDFIFRVIDANDSIISNFDYNSIDVDYYNGVLKFKKEKPFSTLNGDIYTSESATTKYRIEVQYSYERSSNSTFMIGKTIVEGSESVVLNGKRLTKDDDYIIDYDIGFITLLNTEQITSSSLLEITYEYLPYGGQYKQTLLGGRVEYRADDYNYWGVSGLYSTAQNVSEIPSVYSPPKSVILMDSDMSFKLTKEQTKMPFDVTVKGEVAKSIQNPNIFGKALIDNMESISDLDAPSLDKDYWQIASNPNGNPLLDLSKYELSNEDIDLRTINPKVDLDKEKKVETLDMKINNLNANEQVSIVYKLSNEGLNYSEKSYLEAWIYADEIMYDSKASIYFRYGGIDEDVDGNGGFSEITGRCGIGDPKTEDINKDGLLNVGEDIGWLYSPIGIDKAVRIGAGNGKIDTTDLNGNGILDGDDGKGGEFKTLIDEDGKEYTTVDWQGWKKFVIPLGITSSNKTQWETIKNIRITISNNNSIKKINGNLKFYEIAATGNKWSEVTKNPTTGTFDFKVKSVDEESDSEYISIANAPETKGTYESLYKNTTDSNEIKEKALSLQYYNLPADGSGYTSQTLTSTKKYDFSKYEKIKFFLYGDGNNEEFFINFGADSSNYFEYTKKIDWQGYWEIPEISLDDTKNNITGESKLDGIPDGFTSYVGSPRLDNIKYIRIGIRNKTTKEIYKGKIYVNDIYLEGAIEKTGSAYKTELILDLPKDIKLSGNYKHVGSDFETITTGSQSDDLLGMSSITSGRELDSYSGKIEINTFKNFKTSFEMNKEKKVTPQDFLGVFSILEEGKTETENKILTTSFQKEKLPTVSFYYYSGEGTFYDLNLSTETASLYDIREFQKKDIYQVRTDYNIPLRNKFYSQKLYFDYKQEKLSSDLFKKDIGTQSSADDYDLKQLSEEYTLGTDIKILDKLLLKPKYVFLENTENIEDIKWYPKKKQEKAVLNSDVELLKWLRPSFEYNVSKKEDYNIDYSKIKTSTTTTKDLYLENSGNVSLELYAKSIFPKFRQIQSMSLTSKYEIKDINAWDDVDGEYSFVDKWFIRNLGFSDSMVLENLEIGKQSSFSKQDISSFSLKYNPFDFIKDNKKWKRTIKSLNTRTSYQNTITNDLSNRVRTTILPELLLEIREIENLMCLERVISNGEITAQILDKQEYSHLIYDKLTNNLDTKYRFRFLKKLDFSLNYKKENYQEYNLAKDANNEKTKEIDIIKQGIQMSFNYSIWRFTTKYEQNKENEILINADLQWLTEDVISFKVNADFNLEKGLKIPLLKKIIKIDNRVKFDTELKNRKRRSDVLEDNKNIYDIILNGEYNISSNFQIKLGLKYSMVDFVLKEKSNYDAIQISTEASILF